MSTQPKYLLEVGTADQKRLEILGKIYNPFALEFLKQSGLKEGMHILEVGCGMGDMACLLAQAVGSRGKVTATDRSNEQLLIAQEKAKTLGITNIEFKQLAVDKLVELNTKYDLAYARWVLIFLQDPQEGLQAMYDCLKPRGILACEDCSANNVDVFAYPPSKVPQYFESVLVGNFKGLGLNVNFGDSLYHRFKKLSCESLHIKFHQPALLTPEEKSVIRLGFISAKKSILELGTVSEEILNEMIREAELFEQQDNVLAFIRNVLVSGKKPIN
jgi:SAM-dependent methyltransferase